MTPDDQGLGRRLAGAAWWAIPLLFFVGVAVLHPFRDIVELDPDEGNNLVKAMLLAEGHPLYTETWSDQPPIMTWLLRGWLELTGWTLQQGRLLVLACATVLLCSLGRTLRELSGRVAAVSGCVLLIVSMGYVRLSVSVMLAIPSLMFAMLSIQLALTAGRRGGFSGLAWLAVSGSLMALAALTKLWTLPLVPVAALAAVVPVSPPTPAAGLEPRRGRATALAIWSAGLLVPGLLLVMLLVPAAGVDQLVAPHLDVRQSALFDGNFGSFWRRVGADGAMVALGVVGLAAALARKRWSALVPALWAVLAVAVLIPHRPLWYHHALLLAVPLAWGGGLAIEALTRRETRDFCRDLLRRLRSRDAATPPPSLLRGLEPLTVACLLALVVAGAPRFASNNFGAEAPRSGAFDRYLVALMDALAGPARTVVTDRQTLAFAAGLHVPPALAVTSLKRIHGDHLTLDTLVEIVERSRPEQIVLSGYRLPLHPSLLAAIDRHYAVVYSEPDGHRVYVIRRLVELVPEALERAGRLVPDCWQGQLNLAYVLENEGRSDEADAAYRRALAHGPEGLAGLARRPGHGADHVAEGAVP